MGKAAYHLALILDRICDIHKITEDGNASGRTVSFNKAKCKYLAQELTTKIQTKIETSLMPTVKGDAIGPVLRHIAFAVEAAELLVKRSCEKKWWNEIFWMGDWTEAFGDVLLDLQAAIDIAIDNRSSKDRSISRSRSELGQAWNSMVLQDRSFLMSNVRLVVHHKSDLATGTTLHAVDLEIAKHVQAKLDATDAGNVIELGMVRIVKPIVKSITCIKWHGKKCVMKRFESDELAKKEAGIMKELMHPHVVLLLGYARRKNRLHLFSQPSSNILLEYAESGDLREYIGNLQKDLDPDVIVNVMLELAKGMHYIHSKKIAHLDLKSMNVYVTSHAIRDLQTANFFHVKIGDFGTAIRCDEPIPDRVYGQGTPRWRAPELFNDAPRSDLDLYKADVYSYAMVCVELVTRQLPLQDQFPNLPTTSKVYEYISAGNNRPSLPDTYPPELLSIIRRCWDAEPSKRPSFEDIVESLKTLKSEMLLNYKFYSALPNDIIRKPLAPAMADPPSMAAPPVTATRPDMAAPPRTAARHPELASPRMAAPPGMAALPGMAAPPGKLAPPRMAEPSRMADLPGMAAPPRIPAPPPMPAPPRMATPPDMAAPPRKLHTARMAAPPRKLAWLEPTSESDDDLVKRPSFEDLEELFKNPNDKFYSDCPKDIKRNLWTRGSSDTQPGMAAPAVSCTKRDEYEYHIDEDRESTSESDDELVKEATMSPLFVIQTIHPPFNAQGCEMLIQQGEDVRRKIDDFVDGGATIGQHMYTSRASHLQPILGEFQAQLHLLFGDANNLNIGLFDELFNVLKRVEFLLASCSWPAIEFHGGPTATDEAFLSLRKNLQHCVQMMRYRTDTSFAEVSKFLSEDPKFSTDEGSWSRACESDRHMLLQFLSFSPPYSFPKMRPRDEDHHRYLGSIALISKDATMFSESPDSFKIPSEFVQQSDEILWDEGPDGLIMGPMPFLRSKTYQCDETKEIFHQRPVSWAVKVYASETRKLAYDFIKLASLQHPHVVQMFGAWKDGESGYVAMKLMQTNVMQFLSKKQDKTLSAVLLLSILVQIAEGMSYMHSHHVRHHNLKCSNVLVGGFYENLEVVHVEVSDYGFERRRLSKEEDWDSESSSIKDTVQFGDGEETDEYAFDVYQFAMLCSEIFSIRGSREESEATSEATRSESSEVDDEAAAVSFPAKCPRDLALYLQKCGSKDPKERPRFAEICSVLRNHKACMILSGDQGTGSAASE